MKSIFVILAVLFAAQSAFAHEASHRYVTLHTQLGDIVVKLDSKRAPITVKNFLSHVAAKDYDGGSFYRTVNTQNENNPNAPIQVIQGGVNANVKNPNSIILEATETTDLHHLDGTISMARAADPSSAATVFFICVGDQPNLDYGGKRSPDGNGFAAFGHVISGMSIVRQINEEAAAGAMNQYLVNPVLIQSVPQD